MKRLLILPFILFPLFAYAGEMVEVEVEGMSCAACVYGLEMNLSKIEGVKAVNVSYPEKRGWVEMKDGVAANIDLINNAVLNSGFTPGRAITIDQQTVESGTVLLPLIN